MNVHFYGFKSEGLVYLDKVEAEHLENVKVHRGDVLLNITGASIGRVTVAPAAMEGARVNQHVCIVRPKEVLLPQFLAYFFASPAEQARIAQVQVGATRQAITKAVILSWLVPVPPLEEQRQIVEATDRRLSRLAVGLRSLRRVEVRLTNYRSSMLRAASEGRLVATEARLAREQDRLFETAGRLVARTPIPPRPARWKTRSTALVMGHAALAIGRPDSQLPEGWTWAALVDIARMESGHTPSRRRPEWWRGDIPWIGIPDAREHHGRTVSDTNQHINSEGIAHSAARVLPAGTVCVSRTASIGYVVVMGRPMATSQDFVNWVPTSAVTSDWLRAVLSADRNVLIRFGKGSVHKTIYFPEWLAMHIALPPLAEQHRITAEVDRQISILEQARTTGARTDAGAAALRRSILNQAFKPASLGEPATRRSPSLEPSDMLTSITNPATKAQRVTTITARKLPPLRVLRLKLLDGYYSLAPAQIAFRDPNASLCELAPVCLVGLNGSGKSNLLEAVSEIFCHLELTLLNWSHVASTLKHSQLRFEIDYQFGDSDRRGSKRIEIVKDDDSPARFFRVNGRDKQELSTTKEKLDALPLHIIGYSSGQNETLSIPYLRTAALYSEEVLKRADAERAAGERKLTPLDATRTQFMDYESNALVVLANFLFLSEHRLAVFRQTLRIRKLASFEVRFRPTYGSGNRPIKMTKELQNYVACLSHCADEVRPHADQRTVTYVFADATRAGKRLRKYFPDALTFFAALYKLSLLNALALKGRDRKFYLRPDRREGQLEKPPSVATEDRIFSVEMLRLVLEHPDVEIDYAAISDGEHQFLEIFGSVLLFARSGCLFLLDEPETHFNPQWRRRFVQLLDEVPAAREQEFFISTHSPFVVSGCRGSNVFRFSRNGSTHCSQVGFETYGASYDVLLRRLFSLETLVSEHALVEMREVLKSESVPRVENAVGEFGDSLEKRFLYQRIHTLKGRRRRQQARKVRG